MIEVFEGRLGGGKTYSAVLRMVEAWAAGATVCTNVAISWDEVKAYALRVFKLQLDDRQYIALDDDQIPEFHRHTPSNSLVVLDEAHLWFNARDWSQSSRELLAFLTQSRKYGTDIIFISQAAANLDKQFMRLVQFVWRFRDMSKFKIAGLCNWPFDQIRQVMLDYDCRTKLKSKFVWKSKQVFKLYDTNAVYKTSFARLELDTRGQPVKVKKGMSKKMKIGLFGLLLVLLAFCGWQAWKKNKDRSPFGMATGSGQRVVQSQNIPVSIDLLKTGAVDYVANKLSGVVVGDAPLAFVGTQMIRLGETWREWRLVGVSGRTVAMRGPGGVIRQITVGELVGER